MNSRALLWIGTLLWAGLSGPVRAAEAVPAPPAGKEPLREIMVPFEDLDLLLESGPQHVLLSREEYQALERDARKTEQGKPPVGALLTSANYAVEIEQDRAVITGTIGVDGLADGLQTVPLDFAGIGLQSATWGEKPASLGRADDGTIKLFLAGKGARVLSLRAVTALQTTAARQILSFRLPAPPATKLSLTAPGDVEIHSGASLISRVYDEAAQKTRMELLLPGGDLTLVMSLNSRLKRKDRVVMARSVLVDEVTTASERLHATLSLDVLHRAVKDFRFIVPRGFDITEVQSPNLARWAVTPGAGGDTLDVLLREEVTGPVVLNLVATRVNPPLNDWKFPRLEPVDVVGHVAVVGLLLEERLTVRSMDTDRLIPVDRSVLLQALPRTVLQTEAGQAVIRPMVAFYAPQTEFKFDAAFNRPAARLYVTTNALLLLQDSGLLVHGGFILTPLEEKLFQFDFLAPAGWQVTSVTDQASSPLAFERYDATNGASRIHVRLPAGIPQGKETRIFFEANHTPSKWLDEWQRTETDFPVFAVSGAERDMGAVAAEPRDDMTVTATGLTRLTPLDANEKSNYGLTGSAQSLTFRYESQPYAARLVVQRRVPRLTADTYSFFRIERDAVAAHYEVVYHVEDARTRQVTLDLPLPTPTALAIRGLEGAEVKEFTSIETNGVRRWTARLAEARRDRIHLAVDFQMPVSEAALTNFALPLISASGVAYQSGLMAVEGHAELDVGILEHPRRVDIGELADAEYQPGRRLLGAFGFVGDPTPARIAVKQRPSCQLPPALVQRAEISTVFSAQGTCQSTARFSLRNKTSYVEIQLPPQSTLWSVTVNEKPAKPQQERDRVLIALPADRMWSDIEAVYETPVSNLGLWSRIQVPAPRLVLRETEHGGGQEVPVADLRWQVYTPTDFSITASEGTVVSTQIRPPTPAAITAANWLYSVLGGVNPRHGIIGGCVPLLASASVSTRHRLASAAREETLGMGQLGGQQSDNYGADANDSDKSQAAPNQPPPAAPPSATTPPPITVAKPVFQGTPRPPPAADEDREKSKVSSWAVEGAKSLKIDLVRSGRSIEFKSLGTDPRLDLQIVNSRRMGALAWTFALGTLLAGLAMTAAPLRRKTSFILFVLALSTVIPALPGLLGVASVLNGAFYVACALVPYYLLSGPVRRAATGVSRWAMRLATAVVPLVLLLATSSTVQAQATPAIDRDTKYVVEMMPEQPLLIPTNAIVVPYTPDAPGGSRVLVPYEQYQLLWRKSHPADDPAIKFPNPAYAVSSSAFSAILADHDTLTLEGQITVEVFSEAPVLIPLNLESAVLSKALLDGAPARLGSAPGPITDLLLRRAEQQRMLPASPIPAIHVTGKGLHRLDVTLQLKLARQGGWRVAQARLPVAPAALINLRVPLAGTEVVLGDINDRTTYQTKTAEEPIRTALGKDGLLNVRWRPKVNEGEVDRALTAESSALLDIEEDRLRLAWSIQLGFRRGEHDFFCVQLPEGYLVEKVIGLNVRGWQIEPVGAPADASTEAKLDPATKRQLRVGLLKRAEGAEQFTVFLWRPGRVPATDGEAVMMPVVGVSDALRHTGRLTIRRSPLLDIRTVSSTGVRRDNVADAAEIARVNADASESPLGLQAYQTYNFVSVPFDLRLEVRAIKQRTTARVQTIFRMAEHERTLESCVNLNIENRPLHCLRTVVPANLDVETVSAPGVYEWAVTEEPERKLLTVYFATGVQGAVPVVVRGRFLHIDKPMEAPLPCLRVLDVDDQSADLVVQADPAFDVQSAELKGIESVLLNRVYGWLNPAQRTHVRMALHSASPVYEGRFILVPRKAEVSSYTVTNVRITDRAIEETVLIDFTIYNAGIRQVQFTLPAVLADARISVPLLRQKTIEPVEGGKQVRVTLELQSEVMSQLRILVQSDRLLRSGVQTITLPNVLTGRMDRRYVAIESAGRDEVLIDRADGLEPLTRQQKEWTKVSGLFKSGATQAFLATAGAVEPLLAFQTKQRTTVETAGARIGLSQTLVLVDGDGAYRGTQTFFMDNQTEQFLEIILPEGATLWTASVAGEYVKPVSSETDRVQRRVRIPLVKTAGGDLDYAIVLKYGGQLAAIQGMTRRNFPFIRSENINVELSQVELRLPNTHRWMHFDGTLRQIVDEGDFEAGVLSYRNKLAKRLAQSFQYGNPFEKARASSNLKGLMKSMDSYQKDMKDKSYNASLNKELENSEAVLRDLDQQMKQAEATAVVVYDDNGRWLNDAFKEQDNSFARNVVIQNSGNWDDGTVTSRTTTISGGVLTFNDGWLSKNKLNEGEDADGKAPAEAPGGKTTNEPGPQSQPPDKNGGKDRLVANRSAQFSGQAQSLRLNEKLLAAKGTAEVQKEDALSRRETRSQSELAGRYQQKLEQQQMNVASQGAMGQISQELKKAQGGRLDELSNVLLERDERASGDSSRRGEAEGDIVLQHGGLASLDVDFPAPDPSRWTSFRFTTPRGNVEVRGYSITRTGLDALSRVGLAVLVMVLASLILRAFTGRKENLLRTSHGGTLLIVLGAIGLLAGILAVAAVLAIVAGVVMKIVYRHQVA